MTQIFVKPDSASNVKKLLQAAVDSELRIIQLGIDRTKRNLQMFEQKFGQPSEKFYQEFQNGERDDHMEYIKWAGEYETLLQLQQDYSDLSETQLC